MDKPIIETVGIEQPIAIAPLNISQVPVAPKSKGEILLLAFEKTTPKPLVKNTKQKKILRY